MSMNAASTVGGSNAAMGNAVVGETAVDSVVGEHGLDEKNEPGNKTDTVLLNANIPQSDATAPTAVSAQVGALLKDDQLHDEQSVTDNQFADADVDTTMTRSGSTKSADTVAKDNRVSHEKSAADNQLEDGKVPANPIEKNDALLNDNTVEDNVLERAVAVDAIVKGISDKLSSFKETIIVDVDNLSEKDVLFYNDNKEENLFLDPKHPGNAYFRKLCSKYKKKFDDAMTPSVYPKKNRKICKT